MVSVIALVLALVALPSWVHGASYYVATTGNNNNAGTEAAPWLTIHKCVDTMVAGDTCYVRGGTYSASTNIRFQRSGTQSAPIKLLAYQGEVPIINWTGQTTTHRIMISHASGANVAMGWITISGFEIRNGYEGMKFTSMHNSTISNNWIHDNSNQGILGIGGHHNLFQRNIINHNGNFPTCDAGGACNQSHGMYMHGDSYVVTNNLIYDNAGYGIQPNGSSTSVYTPTKHPSTAFAGAGNWVVANNTFAYNYGRGGITIWGGTCGNMRIENNIFYENAAKVASAPQGIAFTSTTCTGAQIRNNHFYGTAPGGTAGIGTGATEGVHYTQSGNVTNVSAPAFVNGGSGTLPISPDFRLTANAPVNIARSNEFPNNSTNVVGAFKTLADPACSITANKTTCTYASITPLQGISATGSTIGCTGSACPGSPAVSLEQKIAGTDAQIEGTITGIAGNACVSLNQTWTKSYDSTSGTWTGGDNIGPYPGKHQKIFSFTNLAVTNACTGSGPPPAPGTPYIEYLFTDGSGTTVTNTGSAGAGGNGTLSSGVTWGTGSVTMTGGTSQSLSIPYGNLVDPSATSLTISFLVNLPAGQESLAKTVFGAPLDGAPIGERFYISTSGGTWRLGIQGTNDGTATDLTTNAGLQHICVTANAATDTVTLHKNGVASVVPGAVRTITSYAIPGNFQLGLLPGLTNGPTATYSHFELYQSVEDCNALYQAAIAPPATTTGTFSQTGVQFESVYTEANGSVSILSAPSQTKKVAKGGAVAVVLQVECNNCQQTAFRLAARDNGAGPWLQVPTTETAANVYMWGDAPAQYLNSGTPSTRVVANGCTIEPGATLLTAAQTPALTLPASGCTMLRYLVKIRAGASGYTEFRLEQEGGVAFTGSYVLGRVDVTDKQAGGMGF